MNLLILFAAIATSALAVSGSQFQSQKLNSWRSRVKYEPAPSKFEAGPSDQFYEGVFRTRIDHFRPQNQDRVDFVYHVNANFYDDGGPIYIYLKDYRDYSTRWIEEGLMYDIARDTGAALVTLDHRFFGRNRPQDTASFEDLELLTIEQCLADIAEFIRFIRQYVGGPNVFSRVILWGSGFGGTLAAWGRSRYPHLVNAAWASSGYLESQIASYGVYDLFQYTFLLNDGGQCRRLIEEAYDEIADYVNAGEGAYLSGRMNLCFDVDTASPDDVASLYENTMLAIMTFFNEYHFDGLRAFCNDLAAIPGEPLNSFARWVRYVYGDAECFDHSYETMIARASNTSWDQPGTDEGRRQWYFLQCTQIGGFLLADSYTWLAGQVPLNYHLEKCAEVFGVELTLDNLTSAFFALSQEFSQAITNVVYTNGYFDPFRYFGRVVDTTGAGVVLNMEYAAKSADLQSRTLNDPESVYEAKTAIIDLVTRWSD